MNVEGKVAVLLMNYGGPSSPEECERYLLNIFKDPDLIPIPPIVRPLVAQFASRRRAPKLRESYAAMGQYSPILEQTEAQAHALGELLGEGYRCYVGMRYFDPTIAEAAGRIAAAGHTKVVHLPLYPQESSTTTGSSLNEAHRAFAALGWGGDQRAVRSFWGRLSYLDAVTEGVDHALAGSPSGALLLFSAHGLPLSLARRDTYPGQIEATCRAVSDKAGLVLTVSPDAEGVARGVAGLAWQSKVGPMKWLEPSVESVLSAAAAAGRRHVIVVPVAFVSEHSETLYELDILYGDIARGLGLGYTRVPTLQTHPGLISALADAVREAAQ